jgi:hypothetical protein
MLLVLTFLFFSYKIREQKGGTNPAHGVGLAQVGMGRFWEKVVGSEYSSI